MNAIAPAVEIKQIPLGNLADSPFQKPRVSKRGNLDELAASMREVGVLEPLLVRPISRDRYEIVAGHRRKLGAALAKLEQVPCIVHGYTDDQVLEIQTVENSQRADVHPLDEADNFAELIKRGRTPAQLAEKIGRPSSYVLQRLQLCELGPECRKALDEEKITLAVALMIARIPDRKLQAEALAEVGERGQAAALTAKRAGEVIRGRFMLRLAEAPFDRGSAELVKKAGACTVCPKRSGNALELFSDVDSPDVCTDPACYRSKLDAHWERVIAEAKVKGTKVLADSAARKVFSQHSERASYDSQYVSLDEDHYDTASGRHVTARTALKGSDVEPTLARNPYSGQIHELVPRKAFELAMKARKREGAKASGSSAKPKKPSAVDKAAAEREAIKAEAKKRADEQVVIALGERVLKLGAKADAVLFELLLPSLANDGFDAAAAAMKRRGLEPKGSYTPAVLKWAQGAKVDEVRALVVELAIGEMVDAYGNIAASEEKRLDGLCKRLGVDRAALHKRATEAVKAARSKAPAASKASKASTKAKSKR